MSVTLTAIIIATVVAALALSRHGGDAHSPEQPGGDGHSPERSVRRSEDRLAGARPEDPAVRSEPRGRRRVRSAWGGWKGHPLVSLAAVTGLIYLNQVLFTVYVIRVHHGDPSFIARYLPQGWFALADAPWVHAAARWFPAPTVLAPSVLRVQAFLELPFVVLAYLTVCRWFSGSVYRRALRLVPWAAASYTVTFGLIEWSLRNPYTWDDLAIRAAAGLVVPLWTARLSRDAADDARGLPGLLVFAASTLGLGLLILVVYDTALLYNLRHLVARLPIAVAAGTVSAAARAAARVVPERPPGRGVDSIARSFGWFLVLFFVPALPVRYGLNFGTADLSAGAGALIVVAAAWYGVRDAFAATPGDAGAWVRQMALSVAAGLCGGTAGLLLPGGHTETRVLQGGAAFFVCAVAVCALLDRRTARLVKKAPPSQADTR
ncbi:hypothetical protein GCM10023196_073530 [Actinoallomurus vinaceus]|uniref:Uncharacterized protein n=1 Tax=Actinoallomurus vinaceus TaxID=1080074 RepID=A0ABP8UN13_9ACTN